MVARADLERRRCTDARAEGIEQSGMKELREVIAGRPFERILARRNGEIGDGQIGGVVCVEFGTDDRADGDLGSTRLHEHIGPGTYCDRTVEMAINGGTQHIPMRLCVDDTVDGRQGIAAQLLRQRLAEALDEMPFTGQRRWRIEQIDMAVGRRGDTCVMPLDAQGDAPQKPTAAVAVGLNGEDADVWVGV